MSRSFERSSLLLLATVAAVTGCADGPIPGLASMNPWLRSEWAADEKFGPTFFQKQTELARLRTAAPSMNPAERAKLANQLAERFREENSHVLRAEIARTLSTFPDEIAEQTLIIAAADQDSDVRRLACEGLSRRSTESALKTLSNVLSSESDLDVRLAAARGLGTFNNPVAVNSLGAALDDQDAAMRFTAMQSLKSSTGKDYGTSVVAWKEYVQGGNPAPPPGPSVAQQLQKWWYW